MNKIIVHTLKMDEKIFNIIINVTNISIYPDYRDSFGSPCG